MRSVYAGQENIATPATNRTRERTDKALRPPGRRSAAPMSAPTLRGLPVIPGEVKPGSGAGGTDMDDIGRRAPGRSGMAAASNSTKFGGSSYAARPRRTCLRGQNRPNPPEPD